mmetsp:Transcript_33291/g.55834  ORF Transcript_33291/g.55834 Transcript_33291/m.55834 type:complete len:203 (+) Transcript_33291:830-1438(+)
MLHGRRLQRAQHDRAVQRIPRHDRPVVEVRRAKRLPLRVVAEVRLEPEALHGGQKRLQEVNRRAGLGQVGGDVAATLAEDGVDGRHAVRRGLHLHCEDGLHEARRGQQEGGVDHAPGGGDQLPAAAKHGLGRELRVEDLELHVADGLVAERTLPRPPLEALPDGVPYGVEQALVHFRGEGVVEEHVGTLLVGPESPDGARRQ